MTIDHVLQLKHVSGVSISPDGKQIAYVLSEPRGAKDKPGRAWSAIWVLKDGVKAPRRYTPARKNAGSPVFTPDNNRLAFTARRGGKDGKNQVHWMPLDGGEAVPLTDAPDGVMRFKLSPDGSKIAYTTLAAKDEAREKARSGGRDETVIDSHHRHHLLKVMTVESKKTITVTPSDKTVFEFDWSPDGTRLAVMMSASPKNDDNYMFRGLWVFPSAAPAKGQQPVGNLLVDKVGKMGQPQWSPGSKHIAWRGASQLNDATTGTLWIIPSDGGTPKALNKGAEETAYHHQWIADNELLVSAVTGTRSHLSRRDLSGGKTPVLDTKGPIYLGFSVDKAGKRFAMSANTSTDPPDVYVGELDGSLERLTHSHDYLKGVDLAVQQSITWKAQDGLEIGGVLIKPLDYKEGTRYPLVLYVHGGPEWQSLDGWSTRYLGAAQVLAANGYAVLMPNYRGSAGRGSKYAMMDHKDLGGQEFLDNVAAVKHLVATGLADSARVGMVGGSYGGYMSALAATRGTDTFAAAINFAGIGNWWSFTGTSDIPHENSLVHWDLYCYDSPANGEKCWKGSPLAYIYNAKTPLMMLHGADDKRVPVSQAWELYTAFRIKKIPTEMVTYPREGHGLAERAHRQDCMERTLAWFDKYLKAPKQAQR